MLKRTLYFGNPAHLYMRKQQLCISINKQEETDDLDKVITRPIEDIGMVVLEHKQITLTHALLNTFMEHNVAVVSCDDTFLPSGLFMPLNSNTIQNERFRAQLEASEPLKKQLWAQTVSAKLRNQSVVLNSVLNDKKISLSRQESIAAVVKLLSNLAADVRSGDSGNYEARGAAVYWQNVFPPELEFSRDRFGKAPNNLLNYGYAIVRACVARALVGSGLLPTLGIHHKNKYNAYCLADDVMEPYRPYVDKLVLNIMQQGDYRELTQPIKQQLLKLPEHTVMINEEQSPLMVAAQKTAASLAKCFDGNRRKILYPEL
jgi:CRISPR-associated protein Cas1